MQPEEHLIDSSTFLYYADYFAVIAESGIQRAKSMFRAINPALRVDSSTFDAFDSRDLSVNNLINTVRLAYDTSFIESNSVNSMSGSFNGLSGHIRKWTGTNINTFLETNAIDVDPTYASISNILGETISSSNIRDD